MATEEGLRGVIATGETIEKLKKLGLEGPHHGRKHPYMVIGDTVIILPNPHQGEDLDASLIKTILRKKISKTQIRYTGWALWLKALRNGCIFCDIIEDKAPCSKIYEDELSLAILDINPFSRGHCLVIPKRHVPWWHELLFRGECQPLSGGKDSV